MRKVAVLILLLVVACSSNIKETIPSWYAKPLNNNELKLYGIGTGFNMETATQAALKNLTSRLLVSISSDATMTRSENNYGYSEEMTQRITEEIPSLELPKYTITNSTMIEGAFYVELSVDTQNFIENAKKSITELDTKINDLDKISKNSVPLERMGHLKSMEKPIADASTLMKVVDLLTNQSNFEAQKSRYSDLNRELLELRQTVTFHFETVRVKDSLVEAFKNSITSSGYKVINELKDDRNVVIVYIYTNEISKEVYGMFNSKIDIYVGLKTYEGKTLKSKRFETSGVSMIGISSASENAIARLGKDIDDKDFLSLFEKKE